MMMMSWTRVIAGESVKRNWILDFNCLEGQECRTSCYILLADVKEIEDPRMTPEQLEGLSSHFLTWRVLWEKWLPGLLSGKESTCQMQETKKTGVWSLGWEDPLEEEMATRSSILAFKIPWTEVLSGCQSIGSHRVTSHWTYAHKSVRFVMNFRSLAFD